MVTMKWLTEALCLFSTTASALTLGSNRYTVTHPGKRDVIDDLVSFDEHSLFIRGERIMFYSGEFHPWRLPVPGLWLDVFQKIKALGYTGVSFYVDWALLEGNPGQFTAEGVFGFEQFFDAAAEAGIYLLARPGPYINAEVSGGGFPGWLQREPDFLRTNMTGYIDATANYVASIGRIIADAQITNGGPVVLFQPENEYTFGADWVEWPDVEYIETVNQQFRDAGIVVPFVNNEAAVIGLFTPGDPGGPDIYGHDSYPGGFDCSDPSNWTAAEISTDWDELHQEQSPNTPYTIPEFQGGALDTWSGVGLDGCAALVGPAFGRIFNKNNYSFGIKIFNLYMTFGGTNWGNLGQPGAYSSYDYGAAIRENRMVDREKYSEQKLQAHFIASSPAYLIARPGNQTNTSYVSNGDITAAPLFGERTNFYVTRHTDFRSIESTDYQISVATSAGDVVIPQLGGALTINGRDSKIHVTDYDVDGVNLIYSSAEILTHSKSGHKRVLLLYGDAGETHEFALPSSACRGKAHIEGGEAQIESLSDMTVVQWEVTPERKVLHYDGLDVYMLWRNEAYNYWELELEAAAPIGNYSSLSKDSVIVKAGYLMRSASISDHALYLVGDLNATTNVEVISGFNDRKGQIYFNGKKLHATSAHGRVCATVDYHVPEMCLPDISSLDWKYIDSLPEIMASYDDSAWIEADIEETSPKNRDDETGELFEQQTPTSLIASDYGFNGGSLIYRGHFTATGEESALNITTQGGGGYGRSVWLNDEYLGSFAGGQDGEIADPFGGAGGDSATTVYNVTSALNRGERYVITVLIDHMGIETNWTPGYDMMKTPRGIIHYALNSHEQEDIAWRLTGNLGGEDYRDQTRGPLNEGSMFAERQGYHLPSPPSSDWESRSPLDGIDSAGVGFFTTDFDLDMPAGYDIPLSFVFNNSAVAFSSEASDLSGAETAVGGRSDYRVQLFVNGWQFGKYINQLGPQTRFAVPEGILNYRGKNTVAMTLWAQQADGAKLEGFELKEDAIIQTGAVRPAVVDSPAWVKREDAY
ncbi:hypothetical protein MBLNU230_g6179t1 [Neophaeotheca triangularis]